MHTKYKLCSLLETCISLYSERTAIVMGNTRLSYTELGRLKQQIAGALALVLPRHRCRIGIFLKNSPDYIGLYFGTAQAEHIPFLIDANFSLAEVQSIVEECSLYALLVDKSSVAAFNTLDMVTKVVDLPAFDGNAAQLLLLQAPQTPRYLCQDDTEVCRFTSGTTGKPKCLEFSGRAVMAAARNWVRGTGLQSEDKVLCLAALSNGLAFNTSLLSVFLTGAELHLYKGVPFVRPVMELIASHNITRLVAFPTLYRLLVENFPSTNTGKIQHLRLAISAGAPLWPDIREKFKLRYGLDISDYYGTAETGPCTFELDKCAFGLGKPLPGVTLRIAPERYAAQTEEEDTSSANPPEEGAVLVRTESMASCYLNQPGMLERRIDRDGFYRPGERGYLHRGRLYLTSRNQDHINVGGRLIGYCREKLAPYKIPARITFIEHIPRNGIGKPRIEAVKRHIAEYYPQLDLMFP